MTIGKYTNLILFLILAFFLPFVSFIAQSVISNDFIKFILYGVQAATPTISAIIVLSLNKKVKTHFSKIFKNECLKLAIILPFTIACITMVGAKTIFCILFEKHFVLGSISTSQFIIILWALVAEEIGWRGYLAPLLKTIGVRKKVIPCVVGVIWSFWHYHFFLQNGIEIPILLFFISCIIESYLYNFIMNATKNNIVSAMVYHFSWNLLLHIAAINPVDNNGSILPYIILMILEVLLLYVFLRIRGTKFSYYKGDR